MSESHVMVRFLVLEPGATEFDDQGRMKGSLDMPLSPSGRAQVEAAVGSLHQLRLSRIFSAPCQSARETATQLQLSCGGSIKVVDCLRNIDHGLWHGKKIEELRTQLPRIYRTGQEYPDKICPPGGETLDDARHRTTKLIEKIKRKYRSQTVALVIPDPLASLVRSILSGDALRDLWDHETDQAQWELIDSSLVTA